MRDSTQQLPPTRREARRQVDRKALREAGRQSAKRNRGGARKALIAILAVVLIIGGVSVGGFYLLRHRFDSQIERFDAFEGVKDRPTPAENADAKQPLNFLILGSDSRISKGDLNKIEYGQQRSDALMVAQLSADRTAVTVMSIPRDSWVDIPGHGKAKINAGLSFGGIPLAVQTVENLTKIHIDHVMLVDFESFKQLTDELGGVTIQTREGAQHMSGDEALVFAQTRKTLPQGDFDRMRRQQAWMRAIAQTIFNQDILTSPTKMYTLLDILTKTTLMDETLTMAKLQSMALESTSLRPGSVRFITAPYAGTGRSPDGKQSIVNLDMARSEPVFDAFANGRAAEFLADNPKAAPSLDDRPLD
ncbi:LCP family protein [Bowdeniella nasicola]|uniref:LCP family protein n=1 Tax=Bowdeniella nasicola TaxID=208480 RepID=UPI000B2CF7C7|nr:LCP family protein [Bowdeniella nasicola]